MPRFPSLRSYATTKSQGTVWFAGLHTRALCAAVATSVAVGMPHPTIAAPATIERNNSEGSRDSARALTEQGQASFDAGDYRDAAAAWRKILDILPENDLNREERENALLITFEAYKHGARRESVNSGSGNGSDVELLREALMLCDAYTEEFARVHQNRSVSPAVVEYRVELERMLADAGHQEPPAPVVTPADFGPQLESSIIRRGPSGTVLIAAGATSIVVGLAMMPLVIIGAKNSKDAEDQKQQAEEEGDIQAADEADRQGRSANAMIISGSILMGVLTIGGATMLGIGIRRRIRYTAFAPALGPSYVGVGLTRRF